MILMAAAPRPLAPRLHAVNQQFEYVASGDLSYGLLLVATAQHMAGYLLRRPAQYILQAGGWLVIAAAKCVACHTQGQNSTLSLFLCYVSKCSKLT
jgi:hypothetical protein